MNRMIAAVLTLVIMVTLAACGAKGSGANEDPNQILIGGCQAVYQGGTIMADCDGDDAIVVTYDFTNNTKDATAFFWRIQYTFSQAGQTLNMTAILQDDQWITDSCYAEVAPGDTLQVTSAYKLRNLTEDVVIDFYDYAKKESASLTIALSDVPRVKSSVAASRDTEAETTPSQILTPAQEYWSGDWYGWWIVTNASGDAFDGWDDGTYWWDCCARIEIEESGDGIMILWDEDGSADDIMDGLEVQISDGGYAQGRMKSVSGCFWDCEMGSADWLVDPDPTVYDHLIVIEGTYTDPEDYFSYFDYAIYLRPWGMDWPDVAGEKPDYLPEYYDSWYLPAIEAGIAMPDVIGGGEFLAPGEIPDEEMEPQSIGALVPIGYSGLLGVVLPDGFFYNEGPICYSSAGYAVSIWLADVQVFPTDSEFRQAIAGKDVTAVTLGGHTVYMLEDLESYLGPSTRYYVALEGMGGFAGCVIPVSSGENDLSATQSDAILDMIASIAPMN